MAGWTPWWQPPDQDTATQGSAAPTQIAKKMLQNGSYGLAQGIIDGTAGNRFSEGGFTNAEHIASRQAGDLYFVRESFWGLDYTNPLNNMEAVLDPLDPWYGDPRIIETEFEATSGVALSAKMHVQLERRMPTASNGFAWTGTEYHTVRQLQHADGLPDWLDHTQLAARTELGTISASFADTVYTRVTFDWLFPASDIDSLNRILNTLVDKRSVDWAPITLPAVGHFHEGGQCYVVPLAGGGGVLDLTGSIIYRPPRYRYLIGVPPLRQWPRDDSPQANPVRQLSRRSSRQNTTRQGWGGTYL